MSRKTAGVQDQGPLQAELDPFDPDLDRSEPELDSFDTAEKGPTITSEPTPLLRTGNETSVERNTATVTPWTRQEPNLDLEAEPPLGLETEDGFDFESGGDDRPEGSGELPELPPQRKARHLPGLLIIALAGTAGLLLVGLLASVFLGNSLFSGSEQNPARTTTPAAVEIPVGKAPSFALPAPETVKSPAERLLTELGASLTELRGEVAAQVRDTQTLREQVAGLQAKLSETQQGPALPQEVGAKLTAVEGALSAVEGLPAAVQDQKEAMTGLITRIIALEQGLGQVRLAQEQAANARSAEQAAEAPPPPVNPPFRLAAIDSWDGVPYAALSRKGHVDLVQAGERYAGWTVEAIDPERREVLFSRDGRRVSRRAPD